MSDVAIRIEGLGKRYRLGQRERYQALRDTLARMIAAPLRRHGARRPPAAVWALKDVTLTIPRGEILGIIGPNGAGKTTLLKILSRITEPTEGRAEIRGRVGSLLEVGTGFHPELTGRENVSLNGAIMGMSRREIERKFDEIVAFSGVETFMETPMKHYSIGMSVRLAFSIAAHLEPEILLVDEVLAVGDAAFQLKCLGKMSEVAHSGRTVLFVSHNMAAIRSLCSRAIRITQGMAQDQGEPGKVISAYLASVNHGARSGFVTLAERTDRSGHGELRAVHVQVREPGEAQGVIRTGRAVEFVIGYAARGRSSLLKLHAFITVVDAQGANVFSCGTAMTRNAFQDVSPVGQVVCRIPLLPLVPGRYSVDLQLKNDRYGVGDHVVGAAGFDVFDSGDSGFSQLLSPVLGSVLVPHEWAWAPEEAQTVGRSATHVR